MENMTAEEDAKQRRREKNRRKRQRAKEKKRKTLAKHGLTPAASPKSGNGWGLINADYLERREEALRAGGWPVSKWIIFCRACLELGLKVGLYEARTTRSKYIFVFDAAQSQQFKVRFSNHRPNFGKQLENDSDFYVGVSNGMVTTTDDALAEVRRRFYTNQEAEI